MDSSGKKYRWRKECLPCLQMFEIEKEDGFAGFRCKYMHDVFHRQFLNKLHEEGLMP
jgi:hypothetical protein